jgi:HKD family nuclease
MQTRDLKIMATKIQILSNTNYPLADVLKSEFTESTNVRIAVAFLRESGLKQIQKSLQYALTANNATVEIIVGLDFKTTDTTALIALKELEKSSHNFNFFCFGDKKDNYNDLVFHPKMYLFEKATLKGTEFTSIVGSSNLTGGGLTTNFEVNSVFKEDTPTYYSQLSAIYSEIKYTDSIFCPSMNYISRYGNIKKELDKAETASNTELKEEIKSLRNEELLLPGTIPSLKKVIIEFMKQEESKGVNEVSLQETYKAVTPMTIDLHMNMNMKTLENTIRGEFNKHEIGSTHRDNIKLFKRVGYAKYTLTEKGRNYNGR